MVFRLLGLSLFILILQPGLQFVQTTAKRSAPIDEARSLHANTAGNAEGHLDGTGLSTASDLSGLRVIGNELTVMPIVGIGSVPNINGLLTLNAVGLAIVQSDVSPCFPARNPQPATQLCRPAAEADATEIR